jgi:methyltransferase
MNPVTLDSGSFSAPLYLIYAILVTLTALQRLWELSCARRHHSSLKASLKETNLKAGEPEGAYLQMVLVHVLWFVGLVVEPLLTNRSPPLWLACTGAVLLLAGQALRIWALRTLGVRWNTRVIVPAKEHAEHFIVGAGPYRLIRHPNYAAVIIEIVGLPLVGGAYFTAAIGTILNALILQRRIAYEERALFALPNYAETVGKNPRFFPKLSSLRTALSRA